MVDRSKEIRELFTQFIKNNPSLCNITLVEEELEWPDFDKFELIYWEPFTDVAFEGAQDELIEAISLTLFYKVSNCPKLSINIKVQASFKREMYLVTFSKQVQPWD